MSYYYVFDGTNYFVNKRSMKILISAPVYITTELHRMFTQKTLDSIKTKHDVDILLIKNNTNDFTYKGAEIINNTKNCVSTAWNMALRRKGYDYVLLPNLDIVFKSDCIDNLVQFAEDHKEAIMVTASEHESIRTLEEAQNGTDYAESPHFSCFMVRGDFADSWRMDDPDGNGLFDENFEPAYFEDLDMHFRLKKAGRLALRTTSALFYHFGSRTIHASDDPAQAEVNLGSTRTRPYFISKWGSTDYSQAVYEGRK